MPIYEYVCHDCGEKFEKFLRTSATEVKLVCPKCGSTRAEKAFSIFGTKGAGGQSQHGANPAPACGPVG